MRIIGAKKKLAKTSLNQADVSFLYFIIYFILSLVVIYFELLFVGFLQLCMYNITTSDIISNSKQDRTRSVAEQNENRNFLLDALQQSAQYQMLLIITWQHRTSTRLF